MGGNTSFQDMFPEAREYFRRRSPLPPDEMKGLFSPYAFFGTDRTCTRYGDYPRPLPFQIVSSELGITVRKIFDNPSPAGFLRTLYPRGIDVEPKDEMIGSGLVVGLAVLHNVWSNRDRWFSAPPLDGVSPLASSYVLHGVEKYILTLASICTPEEWVRYGGGEALLAKYQGVSLMQIMLGIGNPSIRRLAMGARWWHMPKYQIYDSNYPVGEAEREFHGGGQLMGDLVRSCITLPCASSALGDRHRLHTGLTTGIWEFLGEKRAWGDRDSFFLPVPPSSIFCDGEAVTCLDLLARKIETAARVNIKKHRIRKRGQWVDLKSLELAESPDSLLSALSGIVCLHPDLLMEPVNLGKGGKKGSTLLMDVVIKGLGAFGRVALHGAISDGKMETCRKIADVIQRAFVSSGVSRARVGTVMNRGMISDGIWEFFPDIATAASAALACSKAPSPTRCYEDQDVREL